jgi:hypothetical protein
VYVPVCSRADAAVSVESPGSRTPLSHMQGPNMFRLTTNSDSHGAEFHSFQAARRYADCELAFAEEFVITHTPRGGTWYGRAGMPGEQFQLPASPSTPRLDCEWALCPSPLSDRLQ